MAHDRPDAGAHRRRAPCGGAITDFEITQRLIRLIFARAGITRLQRARVLVCVPSAITHVEQRAVLEATRRAGAAQTYLIEQPMAAAIGASLPIHEPLGNMVVDIGGGTSEMAVISIGGIVALQAVRVGGFDFDAAVSAYLRRDHGIAVGERTAEEIKLAIGSAYPTADEFKAEVRGRDLMSGLARAIVLEPEEIREALEEPIQRVMGAIKQALAETPPELAQDLLEMGIHLVGGGGMLRGFDKRIEHETGVPVRMADMPLETVVPRRRPLPRVLRPPARDVHGPPARLLAALRPELLARGHGSASRSSAAWRTCQSLSSLAAASAASTAAPSNGASARTARRRTVGLSRHAIKIASRPSGSPSAPSAATAASRAIASVWSVVTHPSAATSSLFVRSCEPDSPSAHAAATTTVVSSSARSEISSVTNGRLLRRASKGPRSATRRLTSGVSSSRARRHTRSA